MNVDWSDVMAELLQQARNELGWSRQKLAAEAGVSERTIIDLENNARPGQPEGVNPRKSTISKIVRVLDHEELANLAGITLGRGRLGRFRREDELSPDQVEEVEEYIAWLLDRDAD